MQAEASRKAVDPDGVQGNDWRSDFLLVAQVVLERDATCHRTGSFRVGSGCAKL